MRQSTKGRLKRSLATLLVGGGVLVGLGGMVRLTAPSDEVAATEERVLSVAVMPATLVPGYAVPRAFVGRIEARRESRVGFELPGLVTEVRVDEGDVIRKDQVIARLDTDQLELRRQRLVGQRTELKANIELARATRARQEMLTKQGHSSRQRFDEARFEEAALLGRLQQVDADIAAVALDIEKSTLRAPFDAIVAARAVDEGTVVSTGHAIVDLLEDSYPEVRIGVAGDAIAAISVGQTHTLDVRGNEVPAVVRAVLPVRDRATRSVDVMLTLQAPFNGIRRGDLARLQIDRSVTEPGYWLPLTALTESVRGLWAVYVVDAANSDTAVVERRELELLHQEADRVFVRGTLSDGERVVVGGRHRLVPGQRVRVTPASDALIAALEGDAR